MVNNHTGMGELGRSSGRGSPAPQSRRRVRGSRRRTVASSLSVLMATAGLATVASPASADVLPVTAAHAIDVFPMRDFLTVGGYGVGAEMDVRVIRDGVQIGDAGPLTLQADPAIDGFGEVNHPGGICWNGHTPDIVAGDRIEAIDADGNGHFTVVQNVEVTTPATLVDADRDGAVDDIVARGMASNVAGTGRIDQSLVEQRIINPDLKDTAIGRRDVRAIFGDGLADGVTTRGEITWDDPTPGSTDPHWTATYLNMVEPHRDPTSGALTGQTSGSLAEAGQSRMLAWERTDAAGNRIGITLWEFGELGGPGFGGCPAAQTYAVGGASPKSINTLTRNQPNLTLSGTAHNVDTVTVSVDDHNAATSAVVATATVARPVNMTDTSVPMPGDTTWSASIPMAGLLALDDDTLVASATYGRVTETTTDQDTDNDPATPPVPVTTRTSSPIGGSTLNVLKDLQVPGAPTAVPAGGRFTTAQSVTISPANEIEDVVRYRVGGTAATTADPTAASPVVPVPLSVTTTQTVKARSFDPAGNPSAVAAFSYIIGPATSPAAATGVSATPGNGSATVSWTAPVDDGGSAITGFVVRTLQGGAFVKDSAVLPADVRSTVISALTNGTPYTFQVAAVNAVGRGAFSTASSPATTPNGPVTPAAPTGVTAARGDASATVSWVAPAGTSVTGYQVQVRTLAGAQVGVLRAAAATARSLTVTGLTNGTAYTVRVRATSAAGPGAYSAAVGVTPATTPGAPVIGTAASGVAGGAVTATARWAAPTSSGGSARTGYIVRWQRLNTSNAVVATGTVTAGAAATSLSPTLPTTGRYRFAVRASNDVGNGAFSGNSNIVTAR